MEQSKPLEKYLKLYTSTLAGSFGLLMAIFYIYQILEDNVKNINALYMMIIIFSTFYSSLAGYFFSKKMLVWIKIKRDCYLRAFIYGVLAAILTITLIVTTLSLTTGSLVIIGMILAGRPQLPIGNLILQSLLGIIIGWIYIFIDVIKEPLFWIIFFISGICAVLALLIYQRVLNI